jgi:formamidopyrimidine-DNA glycosylase
VLKRAIRAGGSSIRDYVDGNGEAGDFAIRHHVYGRGGEPCIRCGKALARTTVAQRTTVFCAGCQRRYR